MDTIWLEVVLILVAIVANGFFSGSEIAMVSARPSRLAQLRAEGVRGAQRALDLKATPETFLATVQIAITLVGTLASAVGGAAAIEVLTPKLAALPVAGARALGGACRAGCGDRRHHLRVARHRRARAEGARPPQPRAHRLRGGARAARLARLAAAPNRVLTQSTRAVLTLLGQRDAAAPPPVSEEEVKILVRKARRVGSSSTTRRSSSGGSSLSPILLCARS